MDARVHLNPGHSICLKAAFQEHLVEQEKSYQIVILKSAAYCFVFALSIFFSLSLSLVPRYPSVTRLSRPAVLEISSTDMSRISAGSDRI